MKNVFLILFFIALATACISRYQAKDGVFNLAFPASIILFASFLVAKFLEEDREKNTRGSRPKKPPVSKQKAEPPAPTKPDRR